MKVVFAPAGTRGDVEPLVALALEMERRGHNTVTCGPLDYAEFVREQGLTFEIGTPSYSEFLARLRSTPFLELLSEQTKFQFDHLGPHISDADALVGFMLQVAGPSLAERQGIPYFTAIAGPVFSRSMFHPPSGGRPGDGQENLRQWTLREAEWNTALLGGINSCRECLGLQPIENAREHVFNSGTLLFAWDEALAPVPGDVDRGVRTGALCLERGSLDFDVAQFCNARPKKPIFIGFGSMVTADPQGQLSIILESLRTSGQRAVVSTSRELASKQHDEPMYKLISAAPFWQLFPMCSAVIHHGGAGTTGTAARAGVPQAIVPQWSDQYFWAERVAALNIGPVGFRIEDLNVRRLTELIYSFGTQRFVTPASRLASAIQCKHGVRVAADAIERSAYDRRQSRP